VAFWQQADLFKIVVAGYAHLTGGWTFALVRYNTNGTLDTTFGAGGKKTTTFGAPSIAQANSLAIQRDGKIVAAGLTVVNNVANFALARYNSNGTLDTTFGSGGKAVTDFGVDDRAFSVALQSDGKIVDAGMTGADFALARYNTNGTLDATFGSGGKVITDFAGANDIALGVAIRTGTGRLLPRAVAPPSLSCAITATAHSTRALGAEEKRPPASWEA